jgi:hypothetical protein
MPSAKPHKRDSSGGIIHQQPRDRAATPHQREALIGMEEIEKYAGYSETTLKRLMEERGFPMVLFETKWISSKRRVDEWFYALLGQNKGVN